MKTSVQNLKRSHRLVSQLGLKPKYSIPFTSKKGLNLDLADPKTLRLALALMNTEASLGGAASHWGGPSAFVEIMSALHALAFYIANKIPCPWYNMFHLLNDVGHSENGLYALKAHYGMGVSFKDLKGFRSLKSPLTGHGEAHIFPEGVYLSNGPLGSVLAQAQGLSIADKLSNTPRATIVFMSDGALMEGEAKEALNSIPGLFAKGKMNPFLVIVSDNNTKLSGRIDEDSFSLAPFFKSLKTLGWDYVELNSAHNLPQCVNVLEEVMFRLCFGLQGLRENFCQNLPGFKNFIEKSQNKLSITGPLLVHARTIKGYGLKSTAQASHGGHGWPLKDTQKLMEVLEELYGSSNQPGFEKLPAVKNFPSNKGNSKHENSHKINLPEEFLTWAKELKAKDKKQQEQKKAEKNQQALPSPLEQVTKLSGPREKAQVGIGKAMLHCRETKGLPVVSVSADLQGSTGVLPFRKKFPEYSFDVGVAEANMVSLGAGLSKQGFIPVVDTFTQFGVTKGLLPLFMANLSQAPVIAVFSHAGLQDAADGASHQCLSYIANTSALPMTDIYCLSTSEEAFYLMTQAIEAFALAFKNQQVPRTQIFFLGRETFPPSYLKKGTYKLGQAQTLLSEVKPLGENSSKKVSLLAAGPLVEQTLLAGKELSHRGWQVIVLNSSIIHPPDTKTIVSALKKTDFCLLTVEDHRFTGGMGQIVAGALAREQIKADILPLAVKCDFGRSAYQSPELYQREGLLAKNIVQAVLKRWS